MTFSIIIPTHNNLQMLKRCIDSIFRHTHNFEIIVVDNGSTDGTEGFLSEICFRNNKIRYIRNRANQGFACAINKGIFTSLGEFIIWLNDDTIVSPYWAHNMLYCFYHAESRLGIQKTGLVGPITNMCAGKQSLSLPEITEKNYMDFARDYVNTHDKTYEIADFLSGFCLMHSRSLADEIGALDTRFGLGGHEDNDYLLRAEEIGYRGVICHDAFVYHEASATMNKPAFKHLENGLASKLVFLQKYKKILPQKLVTSFLVRDPHPVFLSSVEQASKYSDSVAVTFDNWQDDNLEEILNSIKNVVVYKIANPTTEVERRNIAINNAKRLKPDWILSLDSDEMMEMKCTFEYMHRLLLHPNPHVKYFSFPIFTFWNDERHWRVDSPFGVMNGQRLFKVMPNQQLYSNHPQGYHVPHVPHATPEGTRHAGIKILHYGYVDPEDRQLKYDFYTNSDTSPDREMIGNDDYSHIISPTVKLHEYSGSKTISFNMLYSGEFLQASETLDHVFSAVDDIVVGVTKSDTQIHDLLRMFRVRECPLKFKDDFSALRNAIKNKSTGDWIFYLDPDEALHPDMLPNLQRLLDEKVQAYLFNVRNLHREGPPSITNTVRLFRNTPDMIFKSRVHENLDECLRSTAYEVAEMPWELMHYGYLNPNKDQSKTIELYFRLAKKALRENPKDPLAHFNLALCLQNAGDTQTASNHYRKAANIDKKYYHPRLQLALIHLNASIEWFKQAGDLLPPNHRLSLQISDAIQRLSKYAVTEKETIS